MRNKIHLSEKMVGSLVDIFKEESRNLMFGTPLKEVTEDEKYAKHLKLALLRRPPKEDINYYSSCEVYRHNETGEMFEFNRLNEDERLKEHRKPFNGEGWEFERWARPMDV